jgi:WD40 repeat protein
MGYKIFRLSSRSLLLFACVLQFTAPVNGVEPANDTRPRGDRFGDPLPDGSVARLGTVRWRYPRIVSLVHFFEDGKQLLSCCGDGVIRISDAASGKEIRRFGNESVYWCWPIAISTDGKRFAQGTQDKKRVEVCNVDTGKQVCSFDHGLDDLWGLTFIKSGQLIGWGHADIKVWDSDTGKISRVLMGTEAPPLGYRKGPDCNILGLSVSPDATTLAVTISGWKRKDDKDKQFTTLSLWKLKDGKSHPEIEVPHHRNISPVFSPNSKYVAWPQADGTIQLYESVSL